MKRFKSAIKLLLVFTIILSTVLAFPALAEETSNSNGYRSISYKISSSDLENYAEGGRSGLDIALRSNLPSGVDYTLESFERYVTLTLKFEFSSLDEYRRKVLKLCGPEVAVLCSQDSEAIIIESAEPADYLNCLITTDETTDTKEEEENSQNQDNESEIITLKSLVTVSENILYIDNIKHNIEGCVTLYPGLDKEDEEAIKADYIYVSTKVKRDGTFERKITVGLYNDEDGSKKKYFNRIMKAAGTVKKNEISAYELALEVTLKSKDQSELSDLTSACLGCVVLSSKTITPIDNGNFKVLSQEYFCVSSILDDESKFVYTFTPPSSYANIQPIKEYSYLNEENICSENPIVIFNYNQKFEFSNISVYTDLSSLLGKIERTITFSVSNDVAYFYHDYIKTILSERLPDDSVMTISEDDKNTNYEIVYSAFSASKISKFTNAIFNSKGKLKVNSEFLGLNNKVSETVSLTDILPEMSEYQTAVFEYKLISTASVKGQSSEDDVDMAVEGANVSWNVNSDSEMSFKYKGLNIIHIILVIAGLAAFSLIGFAVYKNYLKKTRQSPNETPLQTTNSPSVSSEAATPTAQIDESDNKEKTEEQTVK